MPRQGTGRAVITVVAVGNAFDGLALWGPFEDKDAASEWADNECRHEEWVLAPVEAPVEDDVDAKFLRKFGNEDE